MKYLMPKYSCFQNHCLGGYRHQMGLPPPDPRSLCPQLNLLNTPKNKIPGYATGYTKKFFRHKRSLQQEANRPSTVHCHMTLYIALTLSHDTVHYTHTAT